MKKIAIMLSLVLAACETGSSGVAKVDATVVSVSDASVVVSAPVASPSATASFMEVPASFSENESRYSDAFVSAVDSGVHDAGVVDSAVVAKPVVVEARHVLHDAGVVDSGVVGQARTKQ